MKGKPFKMTYQSYLKKKYCPILHPKGTRKRTIYDTQVKEVGALSPFYRWSRVKRGLIACSRSDSKPRDDSKSLLHHTAHPWKSQVSFGTGTTTCQATSLPAFEMWRTMFLLSRENEGRGWMERYSHALGTLSPAAGLGSLTQEQQKVMGHKDSGPQIWAPHDNQDPTLRNYLTLEIKL